MSHGRRPTHVDRTYGSKNAIGYRDIVGTHIEEVTKIVGDRGMKPRDEETDLFRAQ